MRTLVVLVALCSLANARPPRKVPEVTIGALTYEPPSQFNDSPTVHAAHGQFLTCYRRSLDGFGFPTFEARFKVVLPINANGTLAPPTISKQTGPDNTGTAAVETCLTKEIKKLRFARGAARKARFTLSLYLSYR